MSHRRGAIGGVQKADRFCLRRFCGAVIFQNCSSFTLAGQENDCVQDLICCRFFNASGWSEAGADRPMIMRACYRTLYPLLWGRGQSIDELKLPFDLKYQAVQKSCFDKNRLGRSVRWERCRGGNASADRAIIYPTNWCHGVLNHCSLPPLGAPSEMFRKLQKFCQRLPNAAKKHRPRLGLYMCVFECLCYSRER